MPPNKLRTHREEKIYAQMVSYRKSMAGQALIEMDTGHFPEKSSS
jgi:hypothetical protein